MRKVFPYAAVLIISGALYVLTCAPGVLWQDSALLAWRICRNDIQGDMGLALAHPLYIMIGIALKRIPLGELFFRLNLLSGVLGAIAVANLFLLLRLWLGRILPGVIGAMSLAVSWTFWWHAVVAEIYTLYAAQMLGELIFLLQYVRTKKTWYLYLLGLLNGLAIANHMWAMFGLACYSVFLMALLARKQIALRHFGIVVLMWIIGAVPYEYLIIKNIIESGDIGATVASVFFGKLWMNDVLNVTVTAQAALENIVFVLLNFPTPNILLLFAGLLVVWKKSGNRSFANIILALLLLYLVFAFRYKVADRYAFFLPFYCLAAALIGAGADLVLQRYRHKAVIFAVLAFALLPVPVYSMTPKIAREHYKGLGERRQRPYRDEYKYFLQPWKAGYTGAQRFCDEAFDIVENDAIIYADSTIIHTLLYVQEAQGKRPDVRIVSNYYKGKNAPDFNEQSIGQLMKDHAIYVVSAERGYCPDFILDNYDTVKKGVLYQVVVRKNAGLSM